MSLDEQVGENTRNIATLALSVARLSTMFEYAEKTREADRADVKEAVGELKTLNGNMVGMMQALALMKDKRESDGKQLVDHETRINSLESIMDKATGASGVIKMGIHAIWAIVTSGGLSFVAWLILRYNEVKQVVGINIGGE